MPLVYEGEGIEVFIFAQETDRSASCFDRDLNEVIVDLDTLRVTGTCGEVSDEFSRLCTQIVEGIQVYLLVMWEQLSKPARD